jgi:hypothetical protein
MLKRFNFNIILLLLLSFVSLFCSDENTQVPNLRHFFAGDHKNPITFGLEIEPDFKNHPKLGSYFIPDKKVTLEEWSQWSLEERNKVGHGYCNRANRGISFFKRLDKPLDGEKEFPELPKKMPCDEPGATELNDFIFNTYAELNNFVIKFKSIFGAAGSQTHVVFNKPAKSFSGIKGYTLFESDLALHERLIFEYKKYLSNKTIVPGTNLISSALFPFSAWRLSSLEKIINDLNWGKLGDNESVGKSLSLNWRTLGYPKGKFGFEIRTYDNSAEAGEMGLKYEDGPEKLMKATKRSADILAKFGDLKTFSIFNDIILDKYSRNTGYREAFKKFSEVYFNKIKSHRKSEHISESEFLNFKKLYEEVISNFNRIDLQYYTWLGIVENDEGRSENQKGRPWYFQHPSNRDWLAYPLFAVGKTEKEKAELEYKVAYHTVEYFTKVIKILSLRDGEGEATFANHKENTDKMRIAVSEWAYRIDLVPYFNNFIDRLNL